MLSSAANSPHQRRALSLRRMGLLVAGCTALWAFLAYVVVPAIWSGYTRRHPWIKDAPRITHTSFGAPGDPLNLAIVGTFEQVTSALAAAGWHPADPLGLRSDLRIALDAIFPRPYADAPVSDLYLFGRKEDVAFEQAMGNSPRQRHHVRLWLLPTATADARPVWVGAATFDHGVELSHTTGQITHRIAPDIDAEREKLVADLRDTGRVAETLWVDDFHTQHTGRNGGGDPYHHTRPIKTGFFRQNWIRPQRIG